MIMYKQFDRWSGNRSFRPPSKAVIWGTKVPEVSKDGAWNDVFLMRRRGYIYFCILLLLGDAVIMHK